MRLSSVIAVVVISAVAYWATGGGSLFLTLGSSELPDSVPPTNATFIGNEQSNPFVD